MTKKVSLLNRKPNKLMQDAISKEKKDILKAMQLQQLNDQASKIGSLLELPLAIITPDKNQPRKAFKNITSLAQSIKENGVIQPIIVTPKNSEGQHVIIAGERRYLASLKAGISTIPCVVRITESDANILLLQLLENDQRENVSPFEEADALKELIEKKNVKKSEVAKVLGRDASWISMRLKIADADNKIRELADTGVIEDVRTLYELKKFSDELPRGAEEFVSKALNNKISGSYRSAILRYRDAWSKKGINSEYLDLNIIDIKEVSKDGALLKIKGSKGNSRVHEYTFKITADFKKILFDALMK